MAQVVSHHAQIQAANAQVVIVSFETAYWAHVWLQETNSPFPFLVDPERVAYRAYGLKASVWRSWSPQNLWYYARAALRGRKISGTHGDPHQLGGDFIIDQQGVLQFAHPSREPTDRPKVAEIMSVLERIQKA